MTFMYMYVQICAHTVYYGRLFMLSLLVKYMYLDAFKRKETYLKVTFITVYFISKTCTCTIVFDSDVQIKSTKTSFK